ncbi:MAG: hypothetical protein NTW29_02735 [Bacteroidetes bacterium]|nr:hypothetical protein [Bacteroidota bacterium]
MRRSLRYIFLVFICFLSLTATAQVQVSKEPFHPPVLENKYIRLLNVWLQPGDTTQFHIHSTPSVFLHFTKTKTAAQERGKTWIEDISVPGKSWYRSFVNDTLIHRVANIDTVPFHVTDIELLSGYQPNKEFSPLPFPVLYENERVVVYQLTKESLRGEMITGPRPMVAELVAGELKYENLPTNDQRSLKGGDFLFISQGANFHLSPAGNGPVLLILIEIR